MLNREQIKESVINMTLSDNQIKFLLKEVKELKINFTDCKCADVDETYLLNLTESSPETIHYIADGIYWAEDDLSEAGSPLYDKDREDMAWSIIKRDDYEEDDDYDGIDMNTSIYD